MLDLKILKFNKYSSIKNMMLLMFILLFNLSAFSQKEVFDVFRTGSIEEVTKLYNEDNCVVNKINEDGYSALTLASYSGNEEIVAFLVDKVETVNGNSKYGSPLMAATVKGNINIVKLLLKHKADVAIADANKITALHYAAMFKSKEIVKLLINAGADANLKDSNGKSALDHAKTLKEEEIIKILKNS